MKINVMADTENGKLSDTKTKQFKWPVVPRIGEYVDLSKDASGIDCLVTAVNHRLEINEVDICVEVRSKEDFAELKKKDGWKQPPK